MRVHRGFNPMRDLPTLVWLIAAVVVSFIHPWIPVPRWLMIHLVLLGAITHAIFVWSNFFADTLLRLNTTDEMVRARTRRLIGLNISVTLVVAGVVTDQWLVTTVGAAGVGLSVTTHAVAMWRNTRRALGTRLRGTIHYYLAAASLLPVGATIGVLLARGPSEAWHDRLVVAHASVNLLGWIGLTIVGTLLSLWPTVLRTKIADGAERAARRALPAFLAAIGVTIATALLAEPRFVAVGVAGYVAALGLVAPAFISAARASRPSTFAAWSILSGLVWLVGCLVTVAIGFLRAESWAKAGTAFADVTPLFVAGFALQVLLGALSHLVPVVLGGGPAPARAAGAVLDRGSALRILLVNGGLVLCALSVPSTVRVLASLAVLVGLVSFIPLQLLAIRASRRAKAEREALPVEQWSRRVEPEPTHQRAGRLRGQVAVGLTILMIAVAGGVAADPMALAGSGAGTSASAGVTPTGETTQVRVEAHDMRFTPNRIEVPAGNRLVIELVNTDPGDVHDLVVDSGDDSGRLRPGEATTMDLGVVGRDISGWCSVLGHRQMGMTLEIVAIGGVQQANHDHGSNHDDHAGHHAAGIDFHAAPDEDFQAHEALLGPVPDATVHRHTFTVSETVQEVAPGLTSLRWLFSGTAPGPLLHGKVGDVFEITLVNDGTIGHSIDFHAGSLAPDKPMRTIAPGEELVYRFTATRAGIWMYHCSTMPMSTHIASGMHGAVIIEPPGLPEADRSYALVQSELYLGADGELTDVDKIAAEKPDAVVFNGYVNQYVHRPLEARVGERIRIWLLDAGPNRPTSFHIVGGQFDTVWKEGAYRLKHGEDSGGAQALDLMPAQGGFVELVFDEAGNYTFVSHIMIDAERGASGIFTVTD